MKRLLLVLLLAGCVNTQEMQQAYLNNLSSQCAGFGFRPGTPQMSDCMMRLHQQRQSAQAVHDANATAIGLGLLNQSQPRTFAPAPMGNTRCTTAGGVMNCTHY